MRYIPDHAGMDYTHGKFTFEISGDRRITVAARNPIEAQEIAKEELARQRVVDERLTARVPVYQGSREIGTMAPDFDPLLIESKSWLYDPRPGDFWLEDGKWIASPQLGPGDLDAIPDFTRSTK